MLGRIIVGGIVLVGMVGLWKACGSTEERSQTQGWDIVNDAGRNTNRLDPLMEVGGEYLRLEQLKLKTDGNVVVMNETNLPPGDHWNGRLGQRISRSTSQEIRIDGQDGLVTYIEYEDIESAEEAMRIARTTGIVNNNRILQRGRWVILMRSVVDLEGFARRVETAIGGRQG